MTHGQWLREKEDFFQSREWRELRYIVIKRDGARCLACGRSPANGIIIHVDHIVPVSKDWGKRLDIKNLQVLCEECNLGKSNTDSTSWSKNSNTPMDGSEFVLLTKEVLDSLRTNGGFTTVTIAALNSGNKSPKSGWIKSLYGTTIPESKFNEAKNGVGKYAKSTLKIMAKKNIQTT